MSDGIIDSFKGILVSSGNCVSTGLTTFHGSLCRCSKEVNLISSNLESKEMTKEDYLEYHNQACEKMKIITKAKNADYTGTDVSPFANFSRVEAVGICSTEQGFLTRMMDKLCRINSFAQKGFLEVKDESVEDTLLDLANYSILMAAYIKSKRNKS